MNLIWEEAAFDEEGQGRLEGKSSGDERLYPEAQDVQAVGVAFGLGQQMIEGFELPTALEILAVQAFTEFFDPGPWFFIMSIVSHLANSSMV